MGLIEVLVLGIGSMQAGLVVMGIGKVGRRRGEFAILLWNIKRVATLRRTMLGRRRKVHRPVLHSVRMCPQDPLLNGSKPTLHPRRLVHR